VVRDRAEFHANPEEVRMTKKKKPNLPDLILKVPDVMA